MTVRVETAGARTWLLVAVALWAICVWLLAAFGLGSRVQALPEDPALLQPLPQAEAVAGESLGPLPQYAEIRERPVFSPDRQHRPFFIDPQGDDDDRMDGFDVVLTSVLITPGLEMAIVQSSRDDGGGDAIRFRVGESAPQVPDWTLISVTPRSATFVGPEGERVMDMRVFDGVGGEPSTPAAATDATTGLVAGSGDPAADEATPGRARPETSADADADAGTDAGAEQSASADQAEAIRRRIEERRARVREQREQQSQQSQAPAEARENP